MQRRSTILLVEDSQDDVFLFRNSLWSGGHDFDLHVVGDATEAIDYLQRAAQGGPDYPVPRFIILDNKMPKMKGTDFLSWLSEHPLCRVIPTVILSGTGQPHDVQKAFDRGAHGYFIKPVGTSELTALIKLIFQYWAESKVPPVKEYEVTAQGEQPVLKAQPV